MTTHEPPAPLDPNFRIELPFFEGPLDLLVFLIQKHELDVLDLPIAFVTERYLSYLGMLQKLNLDVAAEYLVMAAELARIKSKMLLPSSPEDEQQSAEEEEEVDPRAELIRRLLEYQKYKHVAEELSARGVAGRDIFLRGMPAPEAQGPPPLAEVSVFKLLDALQSVLKRAKADLSFEISAEQISIHERMTQIIEVLRDRKECNFESLFEEVRSTYDIVVTFLAILEMAKMRMLRVTQSGPDAEIFLAYRASEETSLDDHVITADGGPPPRHEGEGAASEGEVAEAADEAPGVEGTGESSRNPVMDSDEASSRDEEDLAFDVDDEVRKALDLEDDALRGALGLDEEGDVEAFDAEAEAAAEGPFGPDLVVRPGLDFEEETVHEESPPGEGPEGEDEPVR